MPQLKIEDLYGIKEKIHNSSLLEPEKINARLTVHMGTCGISSGADAVLKVLNEELEASGRKDVVITTSGCAGLCNHEPLVTVERAGEGAIKYAMVDEEKARQI